MMHGICIKMKQIQSLSTSLSFRSVFTPDYFYLISSWHLLVPDEINLLKTKLGLNYI
jgi:hypothetical protein